MRIGTPVQGLEMSTSSRPIAKKRGSEFLCHIKFRNPLPEVPVDARLIDIPLNEAKYTKYEPTLLEQDYEHCSI